IHPPLSRRPPAPRRDDAHHERAPRMLDERRPRSRKRTPVVSGLILANRRYGRAGRAAKRCMIVPLLLTSLVPLIAAPDAAHAANTCNGFIAIEYSGAQNFSVVGDQLRVRLTVGAGAIGGGTKATLNRVRFELDCDRPNPGSPLGLGCTDDGAVIKYLGDATIETTCPQTFTTGHEVGTSPNELVLTPHAPFDIPAGVQNFCVVSFGIEVMSLSDDVTPRLAEEVTGYSAATGDIQCNNGLASAGTQS